MPRKLSEGVKLYANVMTLRAGSRASRNMFKVPAKFEEFVMSEVRPEMQSTNQTRESEDKNRCAQVDDEV